MRVEGCGQEMWIVRDLPDRASSVARWLNERPMPGIREAVAAYATVGVHIELGSVSADDLRAMLEDYQADIGKSNVRHRIPVCYQRGPDFCEIARLVSLSERQVIEAHTSAVYRCEAIGFCPGFPYLSGLPELLSELPRRPEPRLRVEAGMVGITGKQCGVYPSAVPGGWNLIGQTPLVICDPAQGFFPIQAGDEVLFDPISMEAFGAWAGQPLGVMP